MNPMRSSQCEPISATARISPQPRCAEQIVEGVIGWDTDLLTLAPRRLRARSDQSHHLCADPSQRFDMDRTDEPGPDDAHPSTLRHQLASAAAVRTPSFSFT